MATKQQLQDKTIVELRELATKQEIEGRAGMSKDELVAALSGDTEPTTVQKQEKAQKTAAEPDYPARYPLAGMTIKGEGKANAVGLFQTAPDVKEYMTAEEARDKGFYVAPTDEEKAKSAKVGGKKA